MHAGEPVSDHFHQTVALPDEFSDAGQSRFDPNPQRRVCRIANAQPHNHRRLGFGRARRTRSKVLVLGDNRRRRLESVGPDRPIVGLAQTDTLDVDGFMAGLAQPAGQRRRQLGVDQKLHLASDRTA